MTQSPNTSPFPAAPGHAPTPQGMQQPVQPNGPSKLKKAKNVIGLIALITGVLGFIFACIPGALILGWILLPIAFILALVSLFQKGKSKWMGVTALILSIVGTIVGVVVFMSVVSDSFDQATGKGQTKVVEPAALAAASSGPATTETPAAQAAGTRENPYKIGSVIESKDWRVVINSVTLNGTAAVAAANEYNEAPATGSQYLLVNYTTTYLGSDTSGQMPAMVGIEYVTAAGNSIDSFTKAVLPPTPIDSTSALYKGASAKGNIAFEVPTATAAKGVLAVRPGMVLDKVFVAVR
ncbi:hypothetical protein ACQR35_06740 [Pseudarthrobacter sp. J1738]|uniref:hypothetical protein n=1 Tax=Pseudarthrobacter sp. J1738 TaxID=3420446 RepID=UPI003D2DE155